MKHNAGRLRMRCSLRMLMIAMVGFAVVFSIASNKLHRAQMQRDAVGAIRAAGGHVIYDWEDGTVFAAPRSNALRPLLGDDFFDDVVAVELGLEPIPSAIRDEDMTQLIKHLENLSRLKRIYVSTFYCSRKALDEMRKTLPHCTIESV